MRDSIPRHCHHKASGRGYVTLSGEQHYTGTWGSAEADRRYAALLGRWLAGGRRPLRGSGGGLTIEELCTAYLDHARTYYRKDGKSTTEFRSLAKVTTDVRALYGGEPAAAFGAAEFRTMQGHWVRRGLTRRTVNAMGDKLRRIFRWAAGREIVPPPPFAIPRLVPGLRRGRTEARDRPPVAPAPAASVAALLNGKDGRRGLAPRYAAMVRLQLLTAMRPGEVCTMRPRDVDRTGDVWSYRPPGHKMEHAGRERIVAVGPRAQAVLRPWLERSGDPDVPIFRGAFSPRSKRHQPISTGCYRATLHATCRRLGVPTVNPNQLRHTAATRLRGLCGLETTRAVLGHASSVTTEIYADRDRETLERLARDHG